MGVGELEGGEDDEGGEEVSEAPVIAGEVDGPDGVEEDGDGGGEEGAPLGAAAPEEGGGEDAEGADRDLHRPEEGHRRMAHGDHEQDGGSKGDEAESSEVVHAGIVAHPGGGSKEKRVFSTLDEKEKRGIK